MERIKLKNNQEFELIPMGITNDNLGKIRKFMFVSELSYEELKSCFSNKSNVGEIDIVSNDGTVLKSYMDCVGLKSITFTVDYKISDEDIRDIYIIELSTNKLEKEMDSLNSDLVGLCNTLVTMSML